MAAPLTSPPALKRVTLRALDEWNSFVIHGQ